MVCTNCPYAAEKLTSDTFDDLVLKPQSCIRLWPTVKSLPPDGRNPRQCAVCSLSGTDHRRLVVVYVQHHERAHQNQLEHLQRRFTYELRFTTAHHAVFSHTTIKITSEFRNLSVTLPGMHML